MSAITMTKEQLIEALEFMDAGVFIVPGSTTKNGDDRLVVLNAVARSVVEELRGAHGTHVFTYLGEPVGGMHNTAWKRAWRAAGLPVEPQTLRGVHDLRHTWASYLVQHGASDRELQELGGWTSHAMPQRYSHLRTDHLVDAANRIGKVGRG